MKKITKDQLISALSAADQYVVNGGVFDSFTDTAINIWLESDYNVIKIDEEDFPNMFLDGTKIVVFGDVVDGIANIKYEIKFFKLSEVSPVLS